MYFSVSITIGISEDFAWVDRFAEAICAVGVIKAYALDNPKPGGYNGASRLTKDEAKLYLERYIAQMQSREEDSNSLPSIIWIVEGVGYEVDLYVKPGYLRLDMYLLSSKLCKDEDGDYADFGYYLCLLLKTMLPFPVLEIWGGCDDNVGDPEWCEVEGKYWKFNIQAPQAEKSFQMLDIVLLAEFTADILQQLIERAFLCGYKLLPSDIADVGSCALEEIASTSQLKKPFPEQWICIADGTEYQVRITPFVGSLFTRILFRTSEHKDMPHIDRLVAHALNITSDHILEQVITFDSRYNYFWNAQQ